METNKENTIINPYEINPNAPEYVKLLLEFIKRGIIKLSKDNLERLINGTKYETIAQFFDLPPELQKYGNSTFVLKTTNKNAKGDIVLIHFPGFGVYSCCCDYQNNPDQICKDIPEIKEIITIGNPPLDYGHGWNQEYYAKICEHILKEYQIDPSKLIATSTSTGFQPLYLLASQKNILGESFPVSPYNGKMSGIAAKPENMIKNPRQTLWNLSDLLRKLYQNNLKPADVQLFTE